MNDYKIDDPELESPMRENLDGETQRLLSKDMAPMRSEHAGQYMLH